MNKQYTKEEYDTFLPKIRENMMEMPYLDKEGLIYRYGEFFPAELSPFYYNETVAQDYFPLQKKVVEKLGLLWKEKET